MDDMYLVFRDLLFAAIFLGGGGFWLYSWAQKNSYQPVKTIVKFCLIVGVCVGGINFLERHFDDHKMAYSGVDIFNKNDSLLNVHIIDDPKMEDHRYIAFGGKHIFSVNLESKKLIRLCEFPKDTWAPLASHERHINHFVKKIRYKNGYLYYMLSAKIWAIDFKTCIDSDGGAISGELPFPETSKEKLLNSSFAGLTGFICDFELREKTAVVLECNGQMSVYDSKYSKPPKHRLVVAKKLVSPSSVGKSSFELQYSEPNLYLAKIDDDEFVYGNFDFKNALWAKPKLIRYHPDTLSVLKVVNLDCTAFPDPIGYFRVDNETRFIFSSASGVNILTEKDGVCIDYGVREFFSDIGQILNISPFHDNSLRGLAFNGDLIDLAKEQVVSLGLPSDADQTCKHGLKAMHLDFNDRILTNSIDGIFLCSGSESGGTSSLHVRENIKR